VRYGLHLANFADYGDARTLGDLAASAEAAGWNGFFIWDHVARPEGVFPMVDPWIGLAVMATRTERIRLGALVTPLARRRPWNLAREIVSLDRLSGGRMVFGVGLGVTQGPEFNDMGEEPDPRVRGDMLDEGLELVRAAWTGEPVNHQGPHYRLSDVAFLPTPLQAHVPIWAATERLSGRPVRRAAKLDGIFPIGIEPERAGELLAEIERHREGSMDGYDLVAVGTDDAARWRDAGATWWLHDLPWRQPLASIQAIVEQGPPAS
jgi:alkanesulfonate monooxygenase SsuD/methylene tetrahydromethanopterin reductase-like flavin-dependent oxidoreductase (luciferase family)